MEQIVPESEISNVVDNAVIDYLKQNSKLKAIEALENFPRIKGTGKSVVETLREIRQEKSDRLVFK